MNSARVTGALASAKGEYEVAIGEVERGNRSYRLRSVESRWGRSGEIRGMLRCFPSDVRVLEHDAAGFKRAGAGSQGAKPQQISPSLFSFTASKTAEGEAIE